MSPTKINDEFSSISCSVKRYRERKIASGICVHVGCKNPPKRSDTKVFRECMEHARLSSEKSMKRYNARKEADNAE